MFVGQEENFSVAAIVLEEESCRLTLVVGNLPFSPWSRSPVDLQNLFRCNFRSLNDLGFLADHAFRQHINLSRFDLGCWLDSMAIHAINRPFLSPQ